MSVGRGLPSSLAQGFFNRLEDGNPTLSQLMRAAAAVCDIDQVKISSDVRVREVVRARWMVFCLAVHKRGMSYGRVGATLNRDHTTVIHGANNALRLLSSDPEYAAAMERVWKIARAGAARVAEAEAANKLRHQQELERYRLLEEMIRNPVSPVRSSQAPADEAGCGSWTRGQLDKMNRLFCAAFVHSSGGMTYEAQG